MKKLLVFLLMSFVAFSAIGVCAANYSEDFETYETGSTKTDFDVFQATVESDGTNKYAVVNGELTALGKYIDSADGMVTVSVKLLQTEHVYSRALTIWDSIRKNRSLLIWLSDGKLTLSYDNASKQQILANAPIGEWIDISVTLNFDTQLIEQVFVNGKACLKSPMTMLNKDVVIEDAGYIEIRTEKAMGALYVDDISVKRILYPHVISAIDSASVYLNKTQGTQPGTYPKSAFTMLSDTIEKAREMAETENLTDEEQNAIKDHVANAVALFENSVICGEATAIYFNGFETFENGTDITTSHGFLAAKNAKSVHLENKKVVKLTDASRLLYQHNQELEGEYFITLSFMQDTKGKIDLLLDASDAAGKGHGPMIYSDGTNILARDEDSKKTKTVLENYQANQWYDLKVYLDTDNDIYTVYIKKAEDTTYEETCTCTFPAISDGTNEYVMDKLKRICNVQMYNAGSSVYIDNMGLYPYTEEIENALNSVEIEYDEVVRNGETVCAQAMAYDRYYAPCADESIIWSVVSGDAQIDQYGEVTVSEGYCGYITVKAELENGIYDKAQILYLPPPQLNNIKKSVKDGNIIITGKYDIAMYMPVELSCKITLNGTDEYYGCTVDKNGDVYAQISLDASVKSQMAQIVISDSEYDMEATLSHMHYGNDAMELFVEKFNESSEPEMIIAQFSQGIDLGLSDVYDSHQKEYTDFIKSKKPAENAQQMEAYIAEANLVLGVKYATRENIAQIMEKGDILLKEEDADRESLNLSSGKTEKLYMELIGFDADDLEELADEIKNIADSFDEASSKPGKSPSYSGGGGGSRPSGAVSVSGAGFNVVVPEKPEDTASQSKPDAFDDIKEAIWAKEYIEKLSDMNVISGYNGKVRPNDGITRAEFSKMVAVLFDIKAQGSSSFTDVSSDVWYAPTVAAMADAGLIQGYPDGSFRPDSKITRQDAAVILSRCIDKLGIPVYTKNERIDFADSGLFEDYSKKAISDLQSYGVISGKGENMFEPRADITRAETAVMLVNLYSFEEIGKE